MAASTITGHYQGPRGPQRWLLVMTTYQSPLWRAGNMQMPEPPFTLTGCQSPKMGARWGNAREVIKRARLPNQIQQEFQILPSTMVNNDPKGTNSSKTSRGLFPSRGLKPWATVLVNVPRSCVRMRVGSQRPWKVCAMHVSCSAPREQEEPFWLWNICVFILH